ncbi:uncharacterized protein (TIGR01777 family) [Dysgonomonas sp. PFB1-18]|uniref:TIGR01777 family oxidoreductase n=1 Tax=unclassified Dysgonomonas TaxID=2630389 RepID=UPI002476F04E|nr:MULTISPECIES: TIGR01777 family oxidoreductase [unclassified Dysgonomonas]MDH6310210.1 uncharacterized protein (TIGR01777 family) [Dysgonomonas sp. PF1-14]MDH6340029.1 uncharacterized protein (TIGR01777 family) [Dysgonomonas sp. PF1-16]MDH6381864.1 uncharacterized protein (TIGR01777 family) [Dysgonomonas sp. PFB1-18]MDH6398894.1 uncharacterized protein (TIGR01777 family) [Dysgonomonas sp. PF1-23]
MRIFITGGTGLIGSALIRTLLQQGHEITVLTRNKIRAMKKLGDKVTLYSTLGALPSLDEYDAVINLAGESMAGKRWTDKQKEKLCNSRWNITRKLTELIQAGDNPPSVFISGSAIGFYGAQDDNVITEAAQPHDEFTFRLCRKWEALAIAADSDHTRVCLLRTGIVLSRKGGMLALLTYPFRLGLGSVLGKGTQYISWIHIQDMIDGIIFLLNTPEARGVFNFTAPNPVTNKRFTNILSSTLYRPQIFRIPAFLVKWFMGESATMLLDGQRAIPQHLTDLHYRFRFEHLDDALSNLMKGKR